MANERSSSSCFLDCHEILERVVPLTNRYWEFWCHGNHAGQMLTKLAERGQVVRGERRGNVSFPSPRPLQWTRRDGTGRTPGRDCKGRQGTAKGREAPSKRQAVHHARTTKRTAKVRERQEKVRA